MTREELIINHLSAKLAQSEYNHAAVLADNELLRKQNDELLAELEQVTAPQEV